MNLMNINSILLYYKVLMCNNLDCGKGGILAAAETWGKESPS